MGHALANLEISGTAAARYLNVATKTLYRWTEDGRIACRRTPTGRRLYRVADLAQLAADAALRNQCRGETKP